MMNELLIELLGSILSERGKSLLGNSITQSPLQRAIDLTADEFPHISVVVADSLKKWCRGEDFAKWVAAMRAGELEEADDTLADSFISVGKFADGLLNTHMSARRVLAVFFKVLEQELYKSESGLHIEAERQKLRHQETRQGIDAISSQIRQLTQRVTPLNRVREPVRDFIGRKEQAGGLIDMLRAGGQAGIHGMGGVGKTELALDVARQLRPDYPEQIMLDMRGVDTSPREPADALASCIRRLAPTGGDLPEGIEELTALYQSHLSDRRVLIVLDNIADDQQVRYLIPPDSSALLLTAR